ncbi:hypothetical protein DVH24_010834 [Malus domestica]|uniref:Uncharacterized protein n=1 Tax=Malus domestica TaxID=3750 RepID=A0A498JRE5_MALDO|nr:hypothetical protein DVH24_010834 [Malus domestica]
MSDVFEGYERHYSELSANLTKRWTLMWNLAPMDPLDLKRILSLYDINEDDIDGVTDRSQLSTVLKFVMIIFKFL